MRKFAVRWWVADPWECYRREVEALSGETGISIRYRADYDPAVHEFRQSVSAWFGFGHAKV